MAHKSDEQTDRLLRRVFKTDPATAPVEDCPDADVLAAWADGRLTGPMQSSAVNHLSTCPRCQAIVAELARMEPLTEAKAWWRSGLRVRWLVPVTAAAAAVAIWLAVPNRPSLIDEFEPSRQAARQTENRPPAPPTPSASGTAPAPATPPVSPAQPAPAARSSDERERAQTAPPAVALESPTAPAASDQRTDFSADRAAPMKAEADTAIGAVAARKELPEARAAAPVQGAVPAPARAATARGANESIAVAERKVAPPFAVASPDRSVAWRIEPEGAIARSSDGGSTWDTVEDGLGVNLLAGASPSPNVCWLVGRGGAVLLTVDGRRFTRLPFPESVDLAAIQATDGRTAQVTTSRGRIFRTTDGGQTWVETRPQDF